MTTVYGDDGCEFNGETRSVSVALDNDLVRRYRIATELRDDHWQKHIADAIDEKIADAICETFDISESDRENIDIYDKFRSVFEIIYLEFW